MRLTIAVAATALLALSARPVAAQRVGIHAEGGVVHIHGARAAGGGFHVFRLIGRQADMRLDFGAIGDAYGVALDVGIDYRRPTSARWSLVLRAGSGLLIEGPDWAGVFLRVGGGVAWQHASNAFVTVIVDAGTHGGTAGPYRAMVGWERRFGQNRASPGGARPRSRP
jgi:hypothetical protein